jgi:hypothetical protein
VVAGAADQIMQAGAFAAQDEDAVAREIEAVVVRLAAFIEPYDPQIVALEFFESSDQVDDAGDAEMLGRAGAGLDGDRAKRGRAALGEDYAIDAGAIGHAKQGAKILRVFNAVEGEDQAAARVAGRCLEKVLNVEKFLWADNGNDTLMGCGSSHVGKLLAGFGAHSDAGLAALGNELLHAAVVPLAGH